MDKKEIIETVIKDLRGLMDEERKEWSKGYYPSSMEIIGVKVPEQRVVRKDLSKRLKTEKPDEIIAICKDLVDTGIFECQQIAYEVLEKDKKTRRSMTIQDIEDLRKNLDNWVSVDTYSGYVSGPAWRDGIIPDSIIEKWARSENFWERRTAVVSTVALNQRARGGTGDVEKTLWVCEMVASDKDDMVAKALSWALRELSKVEKEPVAKFMEKYDDVLPSRVKREVRKKLETGKKNG